MLGSQNEDSIRASKFADVISSYFQGWWCREPCNCTRRQGRPPLEAFQDLAFGSSDKGAGTVQLLLYVGSWLPNFSWPRLCEVTACSCLGLHADGVWNTSFSSRKAPTVLSWSLALERTNLH
eukprot:6372294-Amphidinium_carterae.1